jgi:hypothetical protein
MVDSGPNSDGEAATHDLVGSPCAETPCLEPVALADLAKDRPARDVSLGQPRIERRNGAQHAALGDRDRVAVAFLIGFGHPELNDDALADVPNVLNVDPHQLGAAERAGEPEQDQGAVPQVSRGGGRDWVDHLLDDVGRSRWLLLGRRPEIAIDAGQGFLDHIGVGGWLEAAPAVGVGDCSLAAANGRCFQAGVGQGGEIG